jgi:hypothetical protein
MDMGVAFLGKINKLFGCRCSKQKANTRDRCYDFLNIFAEKFSENIGVFYSNYC